MARQNRPLRHPQICKRLLQHGKSANHAAGTHHANPETLCRGQAARNPPAPRPDAKGFRRKAGRSLPYLNQMENNNRPVSTTVVLALAQEFGFDVTELSTGDAERMVSDMREALADPVFADDPPPLADLRLTASNAPALARAFLELHRAYRQTTNGWPASTRHWAARRPHPAQPLGRGARFLPLLRQLHRRGRSRRRTLCLPTGDSAAARHRARPAGGGGHQRRPRHRRPAPLRPRQRHASPFVPRRAGNAHLPDASATGPADAGQLLEATLDLARFQSDAARAIAKIGLANYFAGAALMPYGASCGPRRTAGTIWRSSPTASAPPSNRWPPPLDPAAPGRQGHPLLLRPRRSGRHHHQAPQRHAPAIRPLRRRLPAVERAPRLRDPGPFPAATGRNAGRGALHQPCSRCQQTGRQFRRAGAALRHRAGLRGAPRRCAGLCRRPGPTQRPRLRADRHLLPHLRAHATVTNGRCRRWSGVCQVIPTSADVLPYAVELSAVLAAAPGRRSRRRRLDWPARVRAAMVYQVRRHARLAGAGRPAERGRTPEVGRPGSWPGSLPRRRGATGDLLSSRQCRQPREPREPLRRFMAQGYGVIAPAYPGSSGSDRAGRRRRRSPRRIRDIWRRVARPLGPRHAGGDLWRKPWHRRCDATRGSIVTDGEKGLPPRRDP